MKCKIIKIMALTSAVILFTACTAENQMPISESLDFSSTATNESAENEHHGEKLSENPPVQNVQYRIHIASDVSDLKYCGEPITLDVEYITDAGYIGEMEFGFMLVCDGTPIKCEINDNEDIFHKFKISAEQTKKVTVKFTPFGKSGETIAIHPVAVLNPSYRLSETQESFYFYHSILTTAPIELKMEKNNLCEHKFTDKFEKIVSDKDTNVKYGLSENNSSPQYLLLNENSKSSRKLEYSSDNVGKFRFVMGGTSVNADMRVTFLLNSRPVTFNGGYNTLEIRLVENYISYSDITLDKAVNQYDTIYAIISPCGGDYLKHVSLTKTLSYSFTPISDDNNITNDNSSERNNLCDVSSSVSSNIDSEIAPPVSSSNENNNSSGVIIEPNENTAAVRVSLAGLGKNGILYGVNDDNVLMMIDKEKGNIIKTIAAENGATSSTLFLSANTIVRNSMILSDDGMPEIVADIFDENLDIIGSFKKADYLAVSPERKKVFRIELWGNTKYYISDINDTNETEITVPEKNIYLSSAEFVNDHCLLFTGGDSTDLSLANGVIGLYDIDSGSMKFERFPYVNSEFIVFDKGVVFFENSESGRKIVIADENFNLREITTLTPRETNRTAVSYNGEYIATSLTKGTATTFRLYSAQNGKMLSESVYDGVEYGKIAVDNNGTIYACTGKASDKFAVRSFKML